MKFLVVSDIHGSADYTKKHLKPMPCTSRIKSCCWAIFFITAAQSLSQGYNPQEVVALLNPLADKIIAVRGNCDAEVDQMLLNFDILRDCATLFLGGRRITATHGHLFPIDRRRTASPAISICSVIFIYLVIRQENGITLLNPGSITLPKENSPHTYALLDEHEFTIMTIDHEVYQSLTF